MIERIEKAYEFTMEIMILGCCSPTKEKTANIIELKMSIFWISIFICRNWTYLSLLFLSFSEFTETLPPWQSGIALLCPNQNEPIKHAVLREWRNAPTTSWGHDCGWMWLPVTPTTTSPPWSVLLISATAHKRLFRRTIENT